MREKVILRDVAGNVNMGWLETERLWLTVGSDCHYSHDLLQPAQRCHRGGERVVDVEDGAESEVNGWPIAGVERLSQLSWERIASGAGQRVRAQLLDATDIAKVIRLHARWVDVDIEVVVATPVGAGLGPDGVPQCRRCCRGQGKSVWRDNEPEAVRHVRSVKSRSGHRCGQFSGLVHHHMRLESGGQIE
jgi:hypothetical protein